MAGPRAQPLPGRWPRWRLRLCRRRVGARHDLRQDFLLGSERLSLAAVHHQDLVDAAKRGRTVRDHDHDAAALADRVDRAGERGVALRVEIGVRLVQHDQEGVAIQRTRKSDALTLAGGKGSTRFPDLRVVAVRQPQDHVVRAGLLGCRDHRLRRGIRIEAGDVLRNRSFEQLDVLRQIADMLAERVGIPLVERSAIEAYSAAHRRPRADQRTRERRLAGRRGPDDAETGALVELEADGR